MGFLSWLGLEKRSANPQPRPFEEVIARLDRNLAADIGLPGVSVQTAMQVATVMACVRVIANGCATPELSVLRQAPDGTSKVARDVPQFRLLNRRPNDWQTSLEFRRTMTMQAALCGDALAVKVFIGRRLAELIPIRPGYFRIEKVGRFEWRYLVWDEFGPIGNFAQEEVFHLPNWQWDDVKGLDAVKLARSAIGLSMAAENNQASLHANGGRPAGVLTTEQKMSAEGIERLREAWRQFTTTNRNGTAILDSGFKYAQLAMSGIDGQHLETRRMQVEEICRAFDVFPAIIGHADKASTYASAEAFFAAHLIHTLRPWHELWRQRLDEFVLDGDGPLFVAFDTRYLQAGSMKDRAVWARTMAELGIYTRNELRDEEGRDPLPGLDIPLTPLNVGGGPTDGGDNAGA
jgi:HK97 family phage portal protein